MRGLHKSKRVSWASDPNLCQVRLFLSEDSPAQVGLGNQDHLQAKASWLPHSAATTSDDVLPPGFEGSTPTNQYQIRVSEIPVINWKCPTRFVLNLKWQVVAGEESKEIEVQNQREMRVLEAVYPRPSAIPSNPTFPMDTERSQDNDHQIPLVPITPVEDEDSAEVPTSFMGSYNILITSQPQSVPHGTPHCSIPGIPSILANDRPAAAVPHAMEPNIVAAASAALGTISKSSDQANLIDPDLLIKILSNPKIIEKLVTDYGATSSSPYPPNSAESVSSSLVPPLPLVNSSDPSLMYMHRPESSISSSATATLGGAFYTQHNGVVGQGTVPNSCDFHAMAAPQMKDASYYKNLIHQHGSEWQESPQQFGGRQSQHPPPGTSQLLVEPIQRDSKPRIMKPCIYFNSSRGCRHGANCAYQHDASSQQRSNSMPEVQSAKRLKMDREISS